MRYLILHRALRNAGDYLIHERATELITAARPDADLVAADAWRPLEQQLGPAELESFDAVVICGGPGFQPRMYPRLYPLMPLARIRVPLVLLSMGSFFFPADAATIASHRLDEDTVTFLRWVLRRTPLISTRDELSAQLLRRHGIDGVTMTGDVAWYARDERPLAPPAAIEHIAFTPPANPLFFQDGLDLLRALRRFLPDARLSVVSHRDRQQPFERAAADLRSELVDISGSADGFRFYDSVSVHIGYRLHAHLYRLSTGGLSYLIAEDSRGVGALQTLGALGVDPFTGPRRGEFTRRVWSLMPRVGNPRRRATRSIGLLTSKFLRYGDPSASIVQQLNADAADGYARNRAAVSVIATTKPTMTRMLETLP